MHLPSRSAHRGKPRTQRNPKNIPPSAEAANDRPRIGCIGTGRISRIHDMPGVWKYDQARIIAVCDLDANRAEAARTLALDGARIVACLCAWPASVTQRAERLTQDRQSRLFDLYDCARAAENQIVWVAANQTGTTGGLRFLGQSKVVGPGGEVLARTWAKAGLAVAEVDVDAEIERARLVLHHLDERRPELYADKP